LGGAWAAGRSRIEPNSSASRTPGGAGGPIGDSRLRSSRSASGLLVAGHIRLSGTLRAAGMQLGGTDE
jgi:hypothetical protein